MSFSQELQAALAPKHLLNHPFYQSWTRGELSRETLQDYAEQYFHHVQAFPRYISATHSICESLEDRQLLLENLQDEEGGAHSKPHPQLWQQFGVAVGSTPEKMENAKTAPMTAELIENFFSVARSSYAEGLCGLYTYEHQVPEIATTKIDGLKRFYGVQDEAGLEFFTVHEKADIWHRQQCEKLIDALPVADQEKAKAAALKVADSLWNFLSGIQARAEARGLSTGALAQAEGKQGGCMTACGCSGQAA